MKRHDRKPDEHPVAPDPSHMEKAYGPGYAKLSSNLDLETALQRKPKRKQSKIIRKPVAPPVNDGAEWVSGAIEQDFGGSEQDREPQALVISTNKEEAFKLRVQRYWPDGTLRNKSNDR